MRAPRQGRITQDSTSTLYVAFWLKFDNRRIGDAGKQSPTDSTHKQAAPLARDCRSWRLRQFQRI